MISKITVFLMALILSTLLFTACDDDDKNPLSATNPSDMPYDIAIDPADFVDSNFTGNTYFPWTVNSTYIYEGEDEEGAVIRVEEKLIEQTKTIMGVTCVIFHVKEFEDGDLVEETFDWYAQDFDGNVWYFGEDSKEIENGEVVSSAGSWEAGIDGALPGIIMMADPIEGFWYRQEYYEGEAEDVGQVLSLSESVTVPYGSYTNCLQTAEWTPLEKGIVEHKFYAAGVGLLRAIAVEGESGYEDLVDITTD